MKVLFVAGFGPIITDVDKARDFYKRILGLELEEDDDHYFHSGEIKGAKHFALWPLSQAAESCFGTNLWPNDLHAPTSWIEFDVENLEQATEELVASGYAPLASLRKEPWGQTVTRLLSPEGLLIGLTYTPALRFDK